MKVRDFEHYRACYCGLCKQLGNTYGVFSRFLLNYDLVLVALLADSLSGEGGTVRCEGCFASPAGRRPTLHGTAGLRLAADGLVLLSWHKLCDNLQDEGWPKRFFYRLAALFARRMYKKAAAAQPLLDALLVQQMEHQRRLEAAGCREADEVCEPTARMCEGIFRQAGRTESEQRVLARLGLFAGQIVYLLDAAEDFEEDAVAGRYNVFLRAGYAREEMLEAVKRRCRMAAGEMALCYNLLDFKTHKDILDNIFFLGIPQGIAAAGAKRTKRSRAHGQIESLPDSGRLPP